MLLGLSLLVSYISNFGVVVSGSVLVVCLERSGLLYLVLERMDCI